MAAPGECPPADAPAPAPENDGRAFCFRDTPAEPALRLASPQSPQAAAASVVASIALEAPAPDAARRSLEPFARPPTQPWRHSPPVRGPPSIETT